jgi:Tol biopolymer transport system component
MAAILQRAPEPLSDDLPPRLRWAILRCLAKDREERWQTAIDLRAELQRPDEQPARARRLTRPGLVVAVALVVAALGLTILRWPGPAPAEATRRGVVRTHLPPPAGYSFVGSAPRFSPDGSHLDFSALPADALGPTSSRIWVQSLRDDVVTEVPNSTGSVRAAAFSPDGTRMALCVNYEDIHVVGLQGNGRTVVATGGCNGVAWRSDGRILFIQRGSILSVNENGGSGERLLEGQPDATALDIIVIQGETAFVVKISSKDAAKTGYYYFDPTSRDLRFLLKASYARYAAPGWLIFRQDPPSQATSETLHVQRFDAKAGRLTGEVRTTVTAAGFFDVFGEELLAITPWVRDTDLTWHDRAGRVTGMVEPPAPGQRARHPRVSPDGHLLAYATDRGLWVRNLATGATTHVTTGSDFYPIWSNDSRELIFTRDYASLWRSPIDTSGQERKLLDGVELAPRDWSPDGRSITFERGDGLLARLDLTTGRDTPFLQSPTYDTSDAHFSPNGRWVAYSSSEAGGNDVYVAEYPDAGKKWKVSPSGGTQPTWRGDGRELFYLNAKQTLVAVTVDPTGDEPRFGEQRELFAVKVTNALEAAYHVTPDGRRFVTTQVRPDSHPPMQIITNWTALFR